ncbi:MAG TPA: 6,7-dimethyl-8-ribityllumazine synthase [Thermoanaerobaculia bacterium]|nr:6,7-dimethyl-8-ribityllumazine synthase [Thermoanaerobaculia bacterium]
MGGIRVIEGALRADGRRWGVVASRFNASLVAALVDGAVDCLLRHGAASEDLRLVRVPGAWEIPAALDAMAAGGGCDGLVALGVVIRGETPHFDFICGQASRGIAEVSARHRIAVGFGLLTCDTAEQAAARAGGKAGNKGWDAALAAIEMADLLSRLGSGGDEP